MKTLTEFSGTIIRMAAKAEAEARNALPKAAPEAAPAPAEVVAAPAEAAAEGEAPAAVEAPAAPVAVVSTENEALRAALDAAVSKETGVSGDRLARLREALQVVGNKTADVRLVRVYAGEEEVAGAKKIGAHQFVIDVMPQTMKQTFGKPEKEGRGGRSDRGGGGGGKGGGHGGGSKVVESTTGSFSMDSLKDDRGSARKGPGGGRGGPGGGRSGGAKP